MSLNRRYIASLAITAVAILAIGLVVKRQLRVEPTPVATLSEAAAMQQLSQEGQVRRLSSYLEERIDAVGTFVEYVPASQASGLRWRASDTLITTFADRPIGAIPPADTGTARVAPLGASDTLRGQWAILVARTRGGALISAAGIVGGRTVSACGSAGDVEEYLVGVPIQNDFAGGGVFDLDGRLRGVIVRCANRLTVLPVGTIGRLLANERTSAKGAVRAFGALLQPIDSVARTHFATDSGLLVMEVLEASPADRASWQPGDIVVQIDSMVVSGKVPAAVTDSAARSDTATVVLLRGGRRVSTRLVLSTSAAPGQHRAASFGIAVARPSDDGVRVERVDVGSIAHGAGMRPGDVLLRIDDTPVTTATAAQRALDRIARAQRTVFVVFARDSIRRGLLLRP